MTDIKNRLQIFMAIGLAGALEWPLTAFIFAKDPIGLLPSFLTSPHKAFFLHIAASLILFFLAPKAESFFHHQRLWGRLFLSFGFFLPVFGWLLCLALYLFYVPPKDTQKIFEHDPVFEDDQLSVLELPEPAISENDQRQRLLDAVDLMPLADILATQDSDLKRGAVEKLAQLASPEAIAVLQYHRSTPQPEVRFYIIAALTRCKKDMEEEIEAIRSALKKDPTNTGFRLSAARAYLKLAKSGLTDDMARANLTNEAAYQLEACRQDPEAPCAIFELIASIYADKAKWAEALATIDQWLDHPLADVSAAMKKRIIIFYQAGYYPQVTASLKVLLSSGERDAHWQAAAFLWGAAS